MDANILPKSEATELFYRIALSFVPGVGSKTAAVLLNHFGCAKDIFYASAKKLKSIPGIHPAKALSFRDATVLQVAEKELAFVAKQGIQVLLPDMPEFPQRLLLCEDAPSLLYYKGNASLNSKHIVAVIGTRNHTEYGQRITAALVEALQDRHDLLLVSGLALGIDTVAHQAAIHHGIPTVGVLGHGLDRLYPAANRALASQMTESGGLLSEFPSGTKPDKQHFPIRNRIVAGMCDVTVVTESDEKGGAMITAYLACGYNREVAAFPGRVTDNCSRGTNKLIQKNIAALISDAKDLLQLMNWYPGTKKTAQPELFPQLSPDEQPLIALLNREEPVHTDKLLQQSGYTPARLASVLLQLEMKGLIQSLPGKRYGRL